MNLLSGTLTGGASSKIEKSRSASVYDFRDAGLPKSGLRRRTNRFKPAADIDLRMGFSAEVASSTCIRLIESPLEHAELGITALDHEPVIWVISDTATNFASVLLKSGHAVHLAS